MKSILRVILILISVNSVNAQWNPATGINSSHTIHAIAASGNTLIAGGSVSILTSGDLYRSTDEGATWSVINTGIPNLSGIMCLAVKDNFILAGTYEDALLISSNAGLNWIQHSINGSQFTGIFELGVSGNNIIARVNTGLGYYLSTNNGVNWSPAAYNGGITNTFVSNGANFYAASRNGLYTSTNNGIAWTQALNLGLPAYGDSTKPLTDIGFFGSKIFAATNAPINSIFVSTNQGAGWVQTGPTFAQFTYVSGLRTAGSKMFASIRCLNNSPEYGVMLSTNEGASWSYVNAGLPASLSVHDMMVFNNKLYIGTRLNGGVWQCNIDNLTSVSGSQIITPEGFSLSQNYPNPFNPSTIINYQISAPSSVRLNVYDVNGKLVKVLVNKRQEAGSYNVTFDGTGLTSGVYFYKLQTEGVTETRKMLMMK